MIPQGQARVTALRQALSKLGWNEGLNLKIEWRWTGGDIARVREYAAELVRLAPEVILAQSTPNVAALKQATTSIPIVFAVVNDPVAQGFITSMAHPGGNITGFSFLEYSMVGKSLEMLKQIAPASCASPSCSIRTPIPTTVSTCARSRRLQDPCRSS